MGEGAAVGYPMSYARVLARNGLGGGYERAEPRERPDGGHWRRMAAGDLRRLERDQRDAWHLRAYARHAGVTPEQARRVLDGLFDGIPPEVFAATYERPASRHPGPDAICRCGHTAGCLCGGCDDCWPRL